MSIPSHQPAALTSEDPHGEHAHDHGHTIVDWKILVGVLAVLLTFTVLTVTASQAERWVAEAFNVVLPNWVNVAVAMSIATIKGTLVMMYFMQLRYDNLFNTVVMLFCFLAFGLFLGFTAGDIKNRDWVYPWKFDQTSPGGMGMNGTPLVWQARINVAARRYNRLQGLTPSGEPLHEDPETAARLKQEQIDQFIHDLGQDAYDAELIELTSIMDRPGIEAYIAEHGLEQYFARLAHYDPRAAGHHESHDAHDATASSAQRSRPRHGLSGALLTEAPAGDQHGHDSEAAAHGAAEDAARREQHGNQPGADHQEPPGLTESDPGVSQPGAPAGQPQNQPEHQPASPPASAPSNPPH